MLSSRRRSKTKYAGPNVKHELHYTSTFYKVMNISETWLFYKASSAVTSREEAVEGSSNAELTEKGLTIKGKGDRAVVWIHIQKGDSQLERVQFCTKEK